MLAYRVLTPIGFFILTIGILIISLNSLLLDLILRNSLVLSPTSKIFHIWKNMPEPLQSSFYLFHITNAVEVIQNGSKPRLEEKGPYVFQEWHRKFDVVWNKNGTVTYKQIKKWIHVSGDLDENITIANIPYIFIGSEVTF